jgi:predicted MPP superfamily phosphohydrolase
VRTRFAVFVIVVQAILFVAHWFVYQTWITFERATDPPGLPTFQVVLAVLSISFVSASFLIFRFSNPLVRVYYTVAAEWLGVLSFAFFASCACWVLYGAVKIARIPVREQTLANVPFAIAVCASAYGIINANRIRVKHIEVNLRNLPQHWRGHIVAVVTDTHAGPIRGHRFMQRIVTTLNRFSPEIVFIGGDLYDGTKADLDHIAAPWRELSSKHGAYFITGNHEEFSNPKKYLEALARSGVHILNNEKTVVDGLQVIGVHYRDSINPQRFRGILHRAAVDRNVASVLLTHVPGRMQIAEEEGVGLQICGHTHAGQFFPFTWMASRIYGEYTYGLKQFGRLAVYTSSGAGTWGPPMRVGTNPEIVLMRLE